MLSKYRQKREQGFTIIEVLIVLAIAGLIMLVVFLAIPALQRNSRNNQRTTDVANLLGGVGEYVSNNNGALPAVQAAGAAGSTSYTIGASSSNTVEVPLGYFSGANITIIDVGTGVAGSDDEEQVRIVRGAACNGSDADPGPSRGYVALYALENNSQQCRES